ncbi:MAG: hypothetical protein ACK4TG_08000, partial [Thermaurantiacus sp.]
LTWTLRGCWVGAWLAAAVAGWQVHALGLERAHGDTNAIQFGNVAVLLALLAAFASVAFVKGQSQDGAGDPEEGA